MNRVAVRSTVTGRVSWFDTVELAREYVDLFGGRIIGAPAVDERTYLDCGCVCFSSNRRTAMCGKHFLCHLDVAAGDD